MLKNLIKKIVNPRSSSKKESLTIKQAVHFFKKLEKFIIAEWQSGNLSQKHSDAGKEQEELQIYILMDLHNFIKSINPSLIDMAQKYTSDRKILFQQYPINDIRSLVCDVVRHLAFAYTKPEYLITTDIPFLLDILNTPPDKSIQAWTKWTHYWGNVNYYNRSMDLYHERLHVAHYGITFDPARLKNILIDEWQSGKLFKEQYEYGLRGKDLYINILYEIEDLGTVLYYSIQKEYQKILNKPNCSLNVMDEYSKNDPRFILFEVLCLVTFLHADDIEELMIEDIPFILECLDAPPEQALRISKKWEYYWKNLDLPARRAKLLGITHVIIPDMNSNDIQDDINKTLLIAAHQGNRESIRSIIYDPTIAINAANCAGDTALILAARAGHIAIVQELLKVHNIDINAVNKLGETALLYAVKNYDLTIIDELLTVGYLNWIHKNNQGVNALTLSISNDYEDIVKRLLTYKKSQYGLNFLYNNGYSPLILAVIQGNLNIVKHLLTVKDIDVNFADSNGITPLMHAIMNNHTDIIQELLQSPMITQEEDDC